MMHCLSIVRVPRVTLNVGGAIGDENYTMSGPSFDPRYGGCFQLNEGRREQFFFIFIFFTSFSTNYSTACVLDFQATVIQPFIF